MPKARTDGKASAFSGCPPSSKPMIKSPNNQFDFLSKEPNVVALLCSSPGLEQDNLGYSETLKFTPRMRLSKSSVATLMRTSRQSTSNPRLKALWHTTASKAAGCGFCPNLLLPGSASCSHQETTIIFSSPYSNMAPDSGTQQPLTGNHIERFIAKPYCNSRQAGTFVGQDSLAVYS